MFVFMVIFTGIFFSTVVVPFVGDYPPPSETQFTVTGNYSTTNYTVSCFTGYPIQRRANISCSYEIANNLTENEPLIEARWESITGQQYTETFFQPTGNRTGETSLFGPPEADKYTLAVASQTNDQAHDLEMRTGSEDRFFRVFTDTAANDVMYRALVLTFNLIALLSVFAGVGKLSLFLWERVEAKEGWEPGQDEEIIFTE